MIPTFALHLGQLMFPSNVIVSRISFHLATFMGILPDLSVGTEGTFHNGSTGEMELFNPEDRFDFVNDGMGSPASTIKALMNGVLHIILL